MYPGAFQDLGTSVNCMIPLSPWVTFGLGGAAQYYAEPNSILALAGLARRCRDLGMPLRVLGRGSNLLISTPTVPGLVVRLTAPCFRDVHVSGRWASAGAGASLARLISTARLRGLAGLHALVGIPASVGGALRCNAGSNGVEIGQRTHAVIVLTRENYVERLDRSRLHFGYRNSNFAGLVILRATFDLDESASDQTLAEMRGLLAHRRTFQPCGIRSAGCFFKNPPADNAGRLIEAAGLKGIRVGGAWVSKRHANFIVVDPGATSANVLDLADRVRLTVQRRLGVELELEVEVW